MILKSDVFYYFTNILHNYWYIVKIISNNNIILTDTNIIFNVRVFVSHDKNNKIFPQNVIASAEYIKNNYIIRELTDAEAYSMILELV